MNLYVNKNQVVKHIYAGQQKIWKVYQGSSKIWQLNKVNFKDWDSSVLKYEEVVSGNPATAPGDPTREGYEFTGWSPSSFSTITADTDIIAQYEQSTITEVNAVLVTNAQSQTLSYQNKAYGYMVWSGSDLPVWQTKPSLIFDNESYLGQGLANASVTATGYNGQSRTTSIAGRSGIALKSITPKTTVLYTKVKISPYICVYAISENGGAIHNNGWDWTDRSDVTTDHAMYMNSSQNIITGRAYYSRGKYFQVKMTVADSNGTKTLSSDILQTSLATNGWTTSAPSPTTLTFDFASKIVAANLAKDAHTTKLEFLEGTTDSPAWPMVLNACCIYQDTLNQ